MAFRRTFHWAGILLLAGLFLISTGCNSGDDSTGVTASIEAEQDTPTTEKADAGQTSATNNTGNASIFREPPKMAERELHPEVLFDTSLGEIVVRLDGEKAPSTVYHFLDTYAKRGHYNNTIVHHVEKDMMVVAGGFYADMKPVPDRGEVTSEATNGLKNTRGTIAMARDHAYQHSAVSQFFFNLADNPSLDHVSRDSAEEYGYCVFGEVVKGMEVLEKIGNVSCEEKDIFSKLPVEKVVIREIRQIK